MHSNGVVGFMDPRTGGPGAWAYCCEGIEASRLSPQFNYMIAPLWTDLYPVGQSRFSTEGTADYQKYRWENIAEISNMANLNTFGVEIRPSGFVGLNYEKVNIQNQNTFIGTIGDVGLGEYTQSHWGRGGLLSNTPYSIVPSMETVTPMPDPCTTDPLSSPSCPGYAQAYHDQQCSSNPLHATTCPGYTTAYFNQQCSYNALYNQGCPGYDQAYFNQQCSADPLYNQQCTGYASAYYDQQCVLNPLYDSGCSGYDEAYFSLQCSLDALYSNQCSGYDQAYFDQQCSLNTLYNNQCPGYETAYFNQQCSLNPLYNNQCSGYDQAYALKFVIKEPEVAVKVEVVEATIEPTVEPVAEVKAASEVVASPVAVEGVPNITAPAVVASVAAPKEPKAEAKATATVAQAKKPETPLARARAAAVERARQNSSASSINTAENAKSMEEQTAQQEAVLGAMSFVPGFSAYQNSMIPDSPFYKPEQLYRNNRIVDNARAQRQLNVASDRIHLKMIDEQYNR